MSKEAFGMPGRFILMIACIATIIMLVMFYLFDIKAGGLSGFAKALVQLFQL